MTSIPAIRFHLITKHYAAVTALQEVSFSVEPGEMMALVGANGAGKTTTLRMIVGLVRPDSGTVTVQGLIPARDGVRVRQQVCYVPDTPFLFSTLTGKEHLQFQADVYRQPRAMQQALELAEAFRLSDTLSRPAGTYSRGMAQKLALTRALMLECPILLLDEPFNAIDVAGLSVLADLLKTRVAHGGTVVLSSHLLPLLEPLAPRLLVLKDGQVMYHGLFAEAEMAEHAGEWFDIGAADDEDLGHTASVTQPKSPGQHTPGCR